MRTTTVAAAPRPRPPSSIFKPLRADVRAAAMEAATHVSAARLKKTPVRGLLLGSYLDVGKIRSGPNGGSKTHSFDAFLCFQRPLGPSGAKPVDPNQAKHFYIVEDRGTAHAKTFGPFEFKNPHLASHRTASVAANLQTRLHDAFG